MSPYPSIQLSGVTAPRGRLAHDNWRRDCPWDGAYRLVDRASILRGMSTQIAIRLNDDEIDALDREVEDGRAVSRSDAVRRGISYIRRTQRYRGEEAALIELARRGESVYPDLDGVHDLPRPLLD